MNSNLKGVGIINISQIIEELESVAEAGTKVPGLRKRAVVDTDKLTSVVNELRVSVPADIQEANEILKQKDSIVNQAQLEARRIKDAAEQEAERTKEAALQEAEAVVAAALSEQDIKVGESEIVNVAQIKAEETRVQSEQKAEEVTQAAQRRAYQLVDEAEARAANRRDGSDQYAKETLYDLEERLSAQLGQVRRGIDALGTDGDMVTAAPAPSLNGAD